MVNMTTILYTSVSSSNSPPHHIDSSQTLLPGMEQPPSDEDTSSSTSATFAMSASGGSDNKATKYKLMSPPSLPITPSPSSLLLPNTKAEPSPTTGAFFKYNLMQSSSSEAAFSFDTNNSSSNISSNQDFSSFEFQFHTGAGSASGLSSTGASMSAGLNQIQSEDIRQVQDEPHAHSVISASFLKSEVIAPEEPGKPAHGSMYASVAATFAAAESEEITRRDQQGSCFQVHNSDSRDTLSLVTADRSPDDGYNWRKYGQKLVKGSEFPRSYYKCTYPNCEVKKIFERSPNGHITEIVYKGSHDHPKPQTSRRFNPGALMAIHEEKTDDPSFIGQEDKFTPKNNVDPNRNGLSPQQAVDYSQDGVNDEIDEDDPISKRRKIDGFIDITPVIKPIREPRVVVQTLSEVDILDDGYRWRKYGQKVVRGNPNPRSYYKCTNAGCPVRKHVERASHDPKAVITTYEGKHNHDVPTARASSHELAGPRPGSGISRITAEENNSVNLSRFRENGHQNSMGSGIGESQNSFVGSGMMDVQARQVSGCYATTNGGMTMYQTRDNQIDRRRHEAPPLHQGNQYPQNVGRLLMGP